MSRAIDEYGNWRVSPYQESAFEGIADDAQVEVQRVVTYRGKAVEVKRQLTRSLEPGDQEESRVVSIHIWQGVVNLAPVAPTAQTER